MTKKQVGRTRERLLKSACEVFAKKGYRDATIADICKGAGTNIAAVNYHFRNKKTLYVEAWRQAFNQTLEAHRPDGGVSPDAPAGKQLYGRVLSILQRFADADPRSYEVEVMRKELANPTGLLTEVIRKSIEPLRQELLSIVRELLGKRASERQAMLCMRSIMTQCFHPIRWERHRRILDKVGSRTRMPAMNFGVEETAEHITRFSLAGIREIRRQIERGGLADEKRTAARVSGKIVGQVKKQK